MMGVICMWKRFVEWVESDIGKCGRNYRRLGCWLVGGEDLVVEKIGRFEGFWEYWVMDWDIGK